MKIGCCQCNSMSRGRALPSGRQGVSDSCPHFCPWQDTAFCIPTASWIYRWRHPTSSPKLSHTEHLLYQAPRQKWKSPTVRLGLQKGTQDLSFFTTASFLYQRCAQCKWVKFKPSSEKFSKQTEERVF